jgi:hypothetical protein
MIFVFVAVLKKVGRVQQSPTGITRSLTKTNLVAGTPLCDPLFKSLSLRPSERNTKFCVLSSVQ